MDVSPQNGTKPQPMPRWRLGLTVAAALLLLAVVALLRRFGMMIQILGLVLILGLAWGVVARFVAMARGRLNTALFTAPLDADNRPVLLCAMVRVVVWSLVGACLFVALPRAAFGEDAVTALAVIVGLTAMRAGLETLPTSAPNWGTNAVWALASVLMIADLCFVFVPVPKPVILDPPFKGSWVVLQGGGTSMINHHHALDQQRWALDLMAVEDGSINSGEGDALEDFYAWDKPLYAPVAGKVVKAVGDKEDQPLLSLDPENPAGNHVVIQMEDGRFVLLAHLKANSLLVSQGQQVQCGQRLGSVGNSGNTTLPHLHIQVSTHIDLFDEDNQAPPVAFRATQRISAPAHEPTAQGLKRNDVLEVDEKAVCGGAGFKEAP